MSLNIEIEKTLLNSNVVGNPHVYRQILSLIDLTTLEGSDTDQKVTELCDKAKELKVAAICVYPAFASLVSQQLSGSGIKTACVATAFPSGQTSLQIKLDEVKYAIAEGADEIDMVISRGKFLEEKYDYVFDEIKAVKDACGDVHLKVILETGELQLEENIIKASELAIEAGGDFIKTSTGKIKPGATLPAFYIMLNVIKAHYLKTGNRIGIKPAGGISNPEVALQYYTLVKEILGDEWITPDLFRIGASRLATKLLELI